MLDIITLCIDTRVSTSYDGVCVWGVCVGGVRVRVRVREAVESICRYILQQIDHQSQYNFLLAILVGLGSN